MLIEHLPPILIIHLKCFLYDDKRGIKKLTKSLNYTVNLVLPKSRSLFDRFHRIRSIDSRSVNRTSTSTEL